MRPGGVRVANGLLRAPSVAIGRNQAARGRPRLQSRPSSSAFFAANSSSERMPRSMQPGQRLDGRDDGRGIPGRAGSRLGCLRLRCELRCRLGLVLRLVLRGRAACCGAGAAAGVSVTRCVPTSGRLDTSKVPNWLVKVTEPYAPPAAVVARHRRPAAVVARHRRPAVVARHRYGARRCQKPL